MRTVPPTTGRTIANQILWRTNVGSHMWGMNHAGSDFDVFEVFQAPSESILIGRAATASYCKTKDTTPKTDIAGHEIGHVVHQFLTGNVNFLWGIFSPYVIEGLDRLRSFRHAAEKNLSAKSYHSIHGLAMHNWKKYIESGKDVTPKRLNIIGRTLLFGINLLEHGTIEFTPTTLKNSLELERLINALDGALERTVLPKEPANRDRLDEWLLDARMREFRELWEAAPVDVRHGRVVWEAPK